MLLGREAGGVVTDLGGGYLRPVAGSGVIAGNPVMHEWLARTVKG